MNTGNVRILPGGVSINEIDEMHNSIDLLMLDIGKHQEHSLAGKQFAFENCRILAVEDKLESIIKSLM